MVVRRSSRHVTQATQTSKARSTVKQRKQKSEKASGESKDKEATRSQKFERWKTDSKDSPFPKHTRPTPEECKIAHDYLDKQHGSDVDAEFNDPYTPETIHNVLDAIVVALLSAATSWSNAKRAMASMEQNYGSVFAYDEIMRRGREELQETIRCGGLHIRKSKLIFEMLNQVEARNGKGNWDLNYLFNVSDEEAMQELLKYKGIGPKCAFVVMNWCLKRNGFTVDTHVYRLAKLWGWTPESASREKTQAHLEHRIPSELKFRLHFLMIQHGRKCEYCRGGSKSQEPCEVARMQKEKE
ncbi:putative DNA glycosylase [Cercospora beticola]|uniref:Putative DNA glycosylase n=1 Tax=Cercospora beticola TaxID=122368 RepID=A0A2G5HGK9_CERBT|nr:putative DNA glycosylase [Cercospora beticola]PIA91678.1 putative DNA glycosylase [Cercospora beticola]WPB06345.1 hypothetical protein RHO25_011002 [Cercospora beticola]